MTPSELSSDGGRRSYVPEHVRRPSAFTCYVLDAPVVVGSGDAGDSGTSDIDAPAVVEAALAAASLRPRDAATEYARLGDEAASLEARLAVPDTLEFVPRARASNESSNTGRQEPHGAASERRRAAATMLLDEHAKADTADADDDGGVGHAVASLVAGRRPAGRAQGRRQRSRLPDESDDEESC